MNNGHISNARTQLSRLAAAGLAACLLCSLAACGQRGPLFLPNEENATAATPAEEANQEEENDGATTGT